MKADLAAVARRRQIWLSMVFGFLANAFGPLIVLGSRNYWPDNEGGYLSILIDIYLWFLLSIINATAITISLRRNAGIGSLLGSVIYIFMLLPSFYSVSQLYLGIDKAHLVRLGLGMVGTYAFWWLVDNLSAAWPQTWKSWPIVIASITLYAILFIVSLQT